MFWIVEREVDTRYISVGLVGVHCCLVTKLRQNRLARLLFRLFTPTGKNNGEREKEKQGLELFRLG